MTPIRSRILLLFPLESFGRFERRFTIHDATRMPVSAAANATGPLDGPSTTPSLPLSSSTNDTKLESANAATSLPPSAIDGGVIEDEHDVKVDIEHAVVSDDPRKWSPGRKVREMYDLLLCVLRHVRALVEMGYEANGTPCFLRCRP